MKLLDTFSSHRNGGSPVWVSGGIRSDADRMAVVKLPPRGLEVEDNEANNKKTNETQGPFSGKLFAAKYISIYSSAIEWLLCKLFAASANWEGGREARDVLVSARHLLHPMEIKALIKGKTLCRDNPFIDARIVFTVILWKEMEKDTCIFDNSTLKECTSRLIKSKWSACVKPWNVLNAAISWTLVDFNRY